MGVLEDARTYQDGLSLLTRQAIAILLTRWSRVQPDDISSSWKTLLPDATAAIVGAQTVAAEMADPYMQAVLDDREQHVNVEGVAGQTSSGRPIESLLYLPVFQAKQQIAGGIPPAQALRGARTLLGMYAQTTVADSGRLAVTSGMTARSHASGYYRMLRPPSCSRCAVLAGKHYRYNRGFKRHPRCDCVHIPVQESDDSFLFDAREAISAGQVTGLSKREREAIALGADPSQVVNAQRGVYTAGGFEYTTTSTTRRAVAGARILARDIARAQGEVTQGRTFSNFTFDRQEAARYAELFRRGKVFTRLTKSGRVQQYAYRYTRTPRPTPEQIVESASSRTEAIRLLTNFGYIL